MGSDIEVLNNIIGNNGVVEAGVKSGKAIIDNEWKEINLSGFSGYQLLTVNNFLIYPVESEIQVHHKAEPAGTSYYVDGAGIGHTGFNKEYNSSTGILKIKPQYYFYEWKWNRHVNLGGSCNYYKVKIYLV